MSHEVVCFQMLEFDTTNLNSKVLKSNSNIIIVIIIIIIYFDIASHIKKSQNAVQYFLHIINIKLKRVRKIQQNYIAKLQIF